MTVNVKTDTVYTTRHDPTIQLADFEPLNSSRLTRLLRQYLHEMFNLRVETVVGIARWLPALLERFPARDFGGEGGEIVGGERDGVRRLTQKKELDEVSKHRL